MKFLKTEWLNVLLTAFILVLPWQTRFIYGFFGLEGGVSEYGTMSLYASEVIFVLGLLLGYLKFGIAQIPKAHRRPLWLMLGLIGVVGVTSLFSLLPTVSFGMFVHLVVAGLFFVALLDERTAVRKILLAFVFSLIIPVVLGIFQVVSEGSGSSTLLGLASREADRLGDAVIVLKDGTRILRAYGSFPHPNIFGGYLAVGVVITFFLLFDLIKERAIENVRILYAFLFLGLFGGLLLTASRSAILGLALGLALSLLVLKMKNVERAKVLVIPLAALVIGGTILVSSVLPNVVAGIRGGGVTEDRSLSERATQYGEYLSVMNTRSWIFGTGFGTYVYALDLAHPGREAWEYQPVHNVLLLILAETGVLGLAAILFWASTIDRINFARFPERNAVTAFAMGNVILVILFFDHYLWSSWAGLCLIAFVMAMTVRMGEEK